MTHRVSSRVECQAGTAVIPHPPKEVGPAPGCASSAGHWDLHSSMNWLQSVSFNNYTRTIYVLYTYYIRTIYALYTITTTIITYYNVTITYCNILQHRSLTSASFLCKLCVIRFEISAVSDACHVGRPVVLTQFSGDSSGAGKGFCTSATLLATSQRQDATRCDKMRQDATSNTSQHSSSASLCLLNFEKSSSLIILLFMIWFFLPSMLRWFSSYDTFECFWMLLIWWAIHTVLLTIWGQCVTISYN